MDHLKMCIFSQVDDAIIVLVDYMDGNSFVSLLFKLAFMPKEKQMAYFAPTHDILAGRNFCGIYFCDFAILTQFRKIKSRKIHHDNGQSKK